MKEINVLIVDDEDIVVKGIKKGLEHTGFIVDTILGGREAVKLCAKKHYDIVIVDLVMPGMNGVEACKGIKNVSPKTEVLLLSGFPNEIEKHHSDFLDAGGKDLFLRKPLIADEVADAIRKTLNLK